jgi:hypothetical protein
LDSDVRFNQDESRWKIHRFYGTLWQSGKKINRYQAEEGGVPYDFAAKQRLFDDPVLAGRCRGRSGRSFAAHVRS